MGAKNEPHSTVDRDTRPLFELMREIQVGRTKNSNLHILAPVSPNMKPQRDENTGGREVKVEKFPDSFVYNENLTNVAGYTVACCLRHKSDDAVPASQAAYHDYQRLSIYSRSLINPKKIILCNIRTG